MVWNTVLTVIVVEGRTLLSVSVKESVLFHPRENCLAADSKMAWEEAGCKEMEHGLGGG